MSRVLILIIFILLGLLVWTNYAEIKGVFTDETEMTTEVETAPEEVETAPEEVEVVEVPSEKEPVEEEPVAPEPEPESSEEIDSTKEVDAAAEDEAETTESEAAEEVAEEEKDVDDGTLKYYLEHPDKKVLGWGYIVNDVQIGSYGLAKRADRMYIKYKRVQNFGEEDFVVDTLLWYLDNDSAQATCTGKGCASSYNQKYTLDPSEINPSNILEEVKKYHNQQIKSEKESFIIQGYDVMHLKLANGYNVYVDKKTRFPILITNDSGIEVMRAQNVYFETAETKDLQLYEPTLFPSIS